MKPLGRRVRKFCGLAGPRFSDPCSGGNRPDGGIGRGGERERRRPALRRSRKTLRRPRFQGGCRRCPPFPGMREPSSCRKTPAGRRCSSTRSTRPPAEFPHGRPAMVAKHSGAIRLRASPRCTILWLPLRTDPLRIETTAWLPAWWDVYALLRRAGMPADYVSYPDGDHSLVKPLERLTSQQGSVDWFGFWLLNTLPADGDTANRWLWLKRCGEARRANPGSDSCG